MSGARSRAESTQSEPDSTPVSVFCVSLGILIVINIGVVCTILGSRSVRKLFPFLSGVARPQDFFFFISVSGQTVAFARVFAVAVMPCHTFSATRDPGSAPSLGALPLGHSPARPCPWPLALPHAQDRKPPTHMHTKNAVHLAWPSCTLAHSPLSMGHGRPWPLGSSLMSHPPPLRFGAASAQTRRTARQRDGSSFCCCTMSPVTCTT